MTPYWLYRRGGMANACDDNPHAEELLDIDEVCASLTRR